VELTDEQLFELLQNFQFLTPEQQQQLQIILEQRMPGMMQPASSAAGNDRQQSYQHIYDILMDNVRRAKDRLAPLGQVHSIHHRTVGGGEGGDSEETDRRIVR